MNDIRLLMIDNYDSFTFNLVQILRELGAAVTVARNDELTVDQALASGPTHLVISPGPGDPHAAGSSMAMIAAFAPRIPVLGVCLGHQAIGAVFGGRVIRAPRVMHGRASLVLHAGAGVLSDLPTPLEVGRYHSLIVEEASLPPTLIPTARTAEGEIMALRHRDYPCEGVQFHPESVLTPQGRQLLANFLGVQAPAPGRPPGGAAGRAAEAAA